MNEMYSIIDELCKQKNIKVGRMAIEAEVSKSALSDLKNGRTVKLSADNLSKIANYFAVSMDYLNGNEKKPTVQVFDEHDNIVVIDDETRDVIDSLRTRPEMKILFSVSKKATKDDILNAVKIIQALKGD